MNKTEIALGGQFYSQIVSSIGLMAQSKDAI